MGREHSDPTWAGVCEFVRVAAEHGLPRIVSVQNPYALLNRALDDGLDETLHRTGVGLLAYSPLGFGTLTGKYDEPGFDAQQPELGRIAEFAAMRQQRWARPEPWPRRASTTRWRAGMGSRRRRWRWPSATATGASPAPSSA
jgi:aryl-alcohol dehydrogenase-like predicted oxidoreductase